MRIGPLRHPVILLKPIVGPANAFNEPAITWEEAGTVWAKVEELSGAELFKAQEIQANISTSVTIRFESAPPGFDTRWRISYRTGLVSSGDGGAAGSRILEIAAPPTDPEGRRRMLQLLCREATNPAIAEQDAASEALALSIAEGGA